VIDPVSGTLVTLSTTNSNINLNGYVDSSAKDASSLTINAGTGIVTLGDSIGSIAPLSVLRVTGGQIIIKGDVLTAKQQIYTATNITISDNGQDGFLYDLFMRKTKPVDTFTILSRGKTRVFLSLDPLVEFNGDLNGTAANTYSLLVASIYEGFADPGSANEPIIRFNGLVGNIYPFYSANIQTLQYRDRLSTSLDVGGLIEVKGGVQTLAEQNYSTAQMNITPDTTTGATTFRSSQAGQINFDISKVDGQFNVVGTSRLIIDGETNFTGTGIGLTGVSLPVQEARAAAAASSGGNLGNTLKLNKLVKLLDADNSGSEVIVEMGNSREVDCSDGKEVVECK
jgi:hypothetical protein